MEISSGLRTTIITFLQDLPSVDDRNGRLGLLLEASLDQTLLNLITFEGAKTIFFQQLVQVLLQYGQLPDERYALQAVLETAKNRVGEDKRKYCDTLLLRLHEYQQKQEALNISQSEPKDNINSIVNPVFPLRIMVTGGKKVGEYVIKIASLVGQYVVLREHTLISNGATGVDEASCKGAFMACQIRGLNPKNKIHVFRPQKHPTPHVDFGHLEVIGETYEERRNVVVEQSHVVIVLGGRKGTKDVVRQAQIMKKPIVPVRIGEDNDVSVVCWHKMYNQDNDSLPYISIKREELERIDSRQEGVEQVALSALIIAESLVFNKNRIE